MIVTPMQAACATGGDAENISFVHIAAHRDSLPEGQASKQPSPQAGGDGALDPGAQGSKPNTPSTARDSGASTQSQPASGSIPQAYSASESQLKSAQQWGTKLYDSIPTRLRRLVPVMKGESSKVNYQSGACVSRISLAALRQS